MHAAEHTKVLCGVLALDVAGDAVLLLVSDAEGVPVEFGVAAFDGDGNFIFSKECRLRLWWKVDTHILCTQ